MVCLQIAPFMRSCISRQSLNSLLKKGGLSYITNNLNNLNLDKAFDKARLENVRNIGGNLGSNLNNLIRPRDPHAPVIPLPPSFDELSRSTNKPLPNPSPAQDKKKAAVLTDAEIEEPLRPLLDYLDESLAIFKKYLSESGESRLSSEPGVIADLIGDSLANGHDENLERSPRGGRVPARTRAFGSTNRTEAFDRQGG